MNKIFTIILSVLLYLPTSAQEWEQVSTVIDDFRTDHTFGFSIDDVGYLVTGSSFQGELLASFYSYNAETDTWTRKDDFPGGARGFAIGHVYNGKAYFGFGINANSDRLDDLWVYDPATDAWTELASCDCQGRAHPAMTIVNDVLYLTMGGGNTGNLNDHWAYDINTDTWAQKANFPAAPRHHPFQFAIGDFVYAGFGHGDGFISNEWYKYDPSDDTWEQLGTLQAEGRVAGTQFNHEGKGYALSGDGDDHNSMETGEFWEYDPATDAWTQLPSHPEMSRWAPASFIVDGWVYLIGGWTFSVNGGGPGYPTTNWKYPLSPESVSTDDLSSSDFDVYPNPTQDVINLPIELNTNSKVSLYNSEGKLITSRSISSQTLDVKDLSNGVYFLELTDSFGIQTRSRFVKQ